MSENESPTTAGSTESSPAPSPAPAPAPAPAVQPAPRGGAGTVVVSLLLAVVVSAATVATAPHWAPELFRTLGVPDPVAAPQQRLEAADAKLAAAVADLESRVSALGARVDGLAGTAEGGAVAAADLRSAALALAVGELREALRRPGPFDIELATLRAIAGSDPDVEAILAAFAPRATGGIPLRSQLREQFPQAAVAIVAPQGPATADVAREANWYAPWQSVVTQLRYLVRLDTPPADSAFATVQRARARLSADDLPGAVDELAVLPITDGPAKEWLDAAKARVAADRGANALTTLALARMSAK
ncbi:COG4223 family protein [Azospirillum sp. ST 5-10]|uniref:COG4223 family protein n=1 Tax=Azospirillum sp. ST 5-10 TaxID=3445776 RepID=UPI003F49F7B3